MGLTGLMGLAGLTGLMGLTGLAGLAIIHDRHQGRGMQTRKTGVGDGVVKSTVLVGHGNIVV